MAEYNYMVNFDNEDVQDGSTMAERFFFSDSEVFSYNQAVLLLGSQLRILNNHDFKVTGVAGGKTYVLFEGDILFYNWFIDLGADFFRKFSLVNFKDETAGEIYQLDRIELGGKYCYKVSMG